MSHHPTEAAFIPQLPFHPIPPSNPLHLSPTRPRHVLPHRRPRSKPLPITPTLSKPAPQAIFLPPAGLLPLPPDDDNIDLDNSDSDTTDPGLNDEDSSRDTSSPTPPPAHQYTSIDRLLEETTPDYETWVDRNSRRSLATFRGGSQWTLGADELNESLRADFLQRHRHVLAPEEAFGAVFMWDVVVRNSRELERLSWQTVAREKSLPVPDMEDIVRAEEMAPEKAVSRVFYWTEDWGEVKRCVFRKNEVFEEMERTFRYEASPGLATWLEMLARYGVRCILCSSKSKARVERVVEGLGFGEYFTKNEIVCSEDEFDSLEQMILVAALKAERPPGKCVLFTDKPSGITAGHEVSAKVVALIGAHPAYEVKTADEIVSDFDEMVVYNIRRLFSEDGMELMDPLTELEHERK